MLREGATEQFVGFLADAYKAQLPGEILARQLKEAAEQVDPLDGFDVRSISYQRRITEPNYTSRSHSSTTYINRTDIFVGIPWMLGANTSPEEARTTLTNIQQQVVEVLLHPTLQPALIDGESDVHVTYPPRARSVDEQRNQELSHGTIVITTPQPEDGSHNEPIERAGVVHETRIIFVPMTSEYANLTEDDLRDVEAYEGHVTTTSSEDLRRSIRAQLLAHEYSQLTPSPLWETA